MTILEDERYVATDGMEVHASTTVYQEMTNKATIAVIPLVISSVTRAGLVLTAQHTAFHDQITRDITTAVLVERNSVTPTGTVSSVTSTVNQVTMATVTMVVVRKEE